MFYRADTKADNISHGGETMMEFFHFLIGLKVKLGSIIILTPLSFKLSFGLCLLIASYS